MLSSSSSTTQKGTTIVKSVTARKLAAPSGTVQKPTIVRLSTGVNAAPATKVTTPTVTRVVRASTILGASSASSQAKSGGIVIKTNSTQNQQNASGNKTPRIIKISPEQFAALKSGTAGAKIGALLSPKKAAMSSSGTASNTTTRVISSTSGISRVITTSGPSMASSNAAARKTYKILRVSTNNPATATGGDSTTPSNIRIPGTSGTTSAVRVKMEPRSPDKRVTASPAAISHVPDSGGEVRAADSEAAPIDNAALMKQLQEAQKAIADAKRAAEDAQKTAEAVKQELAREKQKVEQLEKEKEKTTVPAAAQGKDLSSPTSSPPPALPPPMLSPPPPPAAVGDGHAEAEKEYAG